MRTGGLRWLRSGDGCLAFIRETVDERVLVVVARTAEAHVDVSRTDLDFADVEPILNGDVSIDGDRVTLRPGSAMAALWRIR